MNKSEAHNKNWFAKVHMQVIRDRDLSNGDKLVYCDLAGYANSKTGECYPSMQTIANDLSMSDRTVKRAIKTLVNKGYIRKVRKGQGRRKTNLYFLPLLKGEATNGDKSAPWKWINGDKPAPVYSDKPVPLNGDIKNPQTDPFSNPKSDI